jgi:Zn-dependent protease
MAAMATALGGFNWAPRIGRIRGMDIRLHLTLLLVVLYWLIRGGYYDGVRGLIRAGALTAALGVVILWHELGHAWAARRSGLGVEAILLWPLGGECQIASPMPGPRTDIFVALAGPGAHLLLVIAAFVPLVLIYGFSPLDVMNLMGAANWLVAGWAVAFWVLAFNLIPAFPLDGGRALRGLLTFRLGEVRATRVAVRLGQVMAGLYFVAGIYFNSMFLMALAVYIFIGAEQELRGVLYAGAAYDPNARDPFFRSLGVRENWSEEAADRSGPGGRSGFFSRLATRWRLRRLQRATERHERIKAEVDRILDKVNREGLPALTGREKKILKQASKEYRGGR